jgi:hypothetical protein
MILEFDHTCIKTLIGPSRSLFWDVSSNRGSELVFDIGFSCSDPILLVPPMNASNLGMFMIVQLENFQ